ncbi:hypothetical protein F2A38_12700, partial [Pseudomonas chlororaphis]
MNDCYRPILLKKSALISTVEKYALEIEIFTLSRGFRAQISRSGAQKTHFQRSVCGRFRRTDFFNRIGHKRTFVWDRPGQKRTLQSDRYLPSAVAQKNGKHGPIRYSALDSQRSPGTVHLRQPKLHLLFEAFLH